MKTNKLYTARIAVVIPYYNAAAHVVAVVSKMPDFIDAVIIVDDQSIQVLPEQALRENIKTGQELVFLKNPVNLGVGGATKNGFQYALENGFDIVVKMDADDQMDAAFLPDLLLPLLKKQADMCKGNRFRDIKALQKMPLVRRMGNLGLSFLTKMATGYWNNFDPNNGYLALRCDMLKNVDFSKLSNRYFFETSLIAQLYFFKARIKDVPMPAIYGEEQSSMKVWSMPLVFSGNLAKVFFKRIFKEYFLYDFNIGSLYLATGFPLFLFGIIYGGCKWAYYFSREELAPTGTIMIVALSIILGFQLLLQAVQYDIINAPKPK